MPSNTFHIREVSSLGARSLPCVVISLPEEWNNCDNVSLHYVLLHFLRKVKCQQQKLWHMVTTFFNLHILVFCCWPLDFHCIIHMLSVNKVIHQHCFKLVK